MKIIFRKLKASKDQYERILPLPSILGLNDRIAISVSANMGKSFPELYLQSYGGLWKDFSRSLFEAMYCAKKQHKVKLFDFYDRLPLLLVPPTFDSTNLNKITKYAEQILELTGYHKITKIHFTHFANTTSDLKSEEIKAILKVFLNPSNSNHIEICIDINERHLVQVSKIYLEVLDLYCMNVDFIAHEKNKFMWSTFSNLLISQEIDLNSSGIYASIYIGRNDQITHYGKNKKRAGRGLLLRNNYIKVGRAKNLMERYKNYEADFGSINIRFHPLFNTDDIVGHEKNLKIIFKEHCLKNEITNRRLEWMSFPSQSLFFSGIQRYLNEYAEIN